MEHMFRVSLILIFTLFFACDDGDIITLELDFDQELELCGDEDSDNYVVFDTRTDPNESLTLLFISNTTNDNIFDPPETPFETTLTINGTNTRFNYRVYNGDPSGLICQEIPDASVSIVEDYESESGTVTITSTYTDDDNDGIPTSVEDANLDGDDDPDTNPTDSDGDGIPDYKDEDDDNDNVPTITENPDPNNDGDISDAQNSDSDLIPDYLDIDDDGDGTITRYEDEDMDGNLLDDFEVGSTVPRYLDPLLMDEFIYDVLNENTFTRTVVVTFVVNNINIEILSADFIELGSYTRSFEQ